MNKIEKFTNKYKVSKTLRFKLEPIGSTDEFIKRRQLIEEDEERSVLIEKMKQIMDEYHKEFIDKTLSSFAFDQSTLQELFDVYFGPNSNDRTNQIDAKMETLRKSIEIAFEKAGSKKLNSEDFINNTLFSRYEHDKDTQRIIEKFKDFTTYFIPFNKNRQNMYTSEAKSTAISFRIINQNLIKFLDNIRIYGILSNALPEETLTKVFNNFKEYLPEYNNLNEYFDIANYSNVVRQKNIEIYNAIIGGRVEEDNQIQIKGINQYVQEYNSTHKEGRLPKLNRLFNQILSDRESISASPKPFIKAQEASDAIVEAYENGIRDNLQSLKQLIANISNYDITRIYIASGKDLTTVSQKVYGSYKYITDKEIDEWSLANPKKKRETDDKYEDRSKKYIKSISSYSLKHISELCDGEDGNIVQYFSNFGRKTDSEASDIFTRIEQLYCEAETLIKLESITDEYFRKNSILVKPFLDGIKEALAFVRPLLGPNNQSNKDDQFYSELYAVYNSIDSIITPLYNKVRNFATKKLYSTKSFKVCFGIPYILGGWSDHNQYKGALFTGEENEYYLGILTKGGGSVQFFPIDQESGLKHVNYAYVADPTKDIPNLMVIDGKTVKKNGRKDKATGENKELEELKNKYLPENINCIRKSRSYDVSSETFNKADLAEYINYYKQRIIEYKTNLNFSLKNGNEYNSYNEFLDDVSSQAYSLSFENVSWQDIHKLIDDGKLLLFRITNKDFSPHSKGKPNLHTIYWKMLFDPENLKDVVYKLSGNAEIFYRRASVKNPVVHKANEPIKNKCQYSENETSTYAYDIIKDRRFTKNQYELHVPIEINYKNNLKFNNKSFNAECREFMRNNGIDHIIGIDRGERHLLYLVVIDKNGKIVEQKSLNQVASNPLIPEFKQDYKELLATRAGDRDEARKNWSVIANIKEIKEGYMSQIVHEIAQLMVKYNAIVVLEDLNRSFMQKRDGIEKSVYQKFEKMLIDKLGLLVDKNKAANEPGGALHALQLAGKYEDFNKKENGMVRQCGFIFYIPAWCTSNIDPATGFVPLIRCKYKNIPIRQAKEFFEAFDDICFDSETNCFRFDFDYDNKTFRTSSKGGKRKWSAYTYGNRVFNKRDESQNGHFVSTEICLTDEFKALFEQFGIDIRENLKAAICAQKSKEFFERLMWLTRMMFQLRNSKTGTTDDFILSPIKSADGTFFDSRKSDGSMPANADANGAYNIARKGLMITQQLANADNAKDFKPEVNNETWLNFAQK